MGWDPWEPYHYEGVNGEVQGLDIELVSAMAEGAGCELEFERGEWSQLLQFLQDGRIDLLAGATMVEERESYARFSNPYRTETFTLHVGADAVLQGNDLNALLDNGFRLGLTEGYIYGPQITVLQDNPLMATRIIYAPIAEYHFNNLKDGRIDGFLEDPYVAEATARRHGWTNLTRELPLRFGGEEVRLMFSRETVDEAVVERMNRALAEMRSDGSHTEILQQYQHQGP
ncbi:MAG: transporter substrate-binding domain-containing protein [Wenzhouxiangellaceae bacterium]